MQSVHISVCWVPPLNPAGFHLFRGQKWQKGEFELAFGRGLQAEWTIKDLIFLFGLIGRNGGTTVSNLPSVGRRRGWCAEGIIEEVFSSKHLGEILSAQTGQIDNLSEGETIQESWALGNHAGRAGHSYILHVVMFWHHGPSWAGDITFEKQFRSVFLLQISHFPHISP